VWHSRHIDGHRAIIGSWSAPVWFKGNRGTGTRISFGLGRPPGRGFFFEPQTYRRSLRARSQWLAKSSHELSDAGDDLLMRDRLDQHGHLRPGLAYGGAGMCRMKEERHAMMEQSLAHGAAVPVAEPDIYHSRRNIIATDQLQRFGCIGRRR
jgi:hypothetical protein